MWIRAKSLKTDLGPVAIVSEAHSQRLRAVVLAQEDGQQLGGGALPSPRAALLVNLGKRPQVKDVGDAEPLEGGHAVVLEVRQVGGAEDDAPSDGLARLPVEGVSARIAEVVDAGDVDKGG